jgi:hypothetical protein
MAITEVTDDEFLAYETVRESGVTNMFDTRVVTELSGLTRQQILFIMENYSTLKERVGE